MSKNGRAPARRVNGCVRRAISALALVAAIFAGGLISSPTALLADGGLESQKGGLFHRKGWINPAIHRKDPSAPRKYASSDRSNLGGPQTSSAGDRPRATRNKRRIPARIVRKRERTVAKTRRSKSARKRVRVASLGKTLELPAETKTKQSASVTGGSSRIQWVASSRCVPGRLRSAINHVARNFGSVRVSSTCRSRRRNARVGGASRSYHLKGQAADFRVFGNIGAAARYLRGVVGGFRHYGGGLFHIDTGPRRSW